MLLATGSGKPTPPPRHEPTAGSAPPADAMTRTPPERTLRSGEEEHDMKSGADEAMKAKERRFAKPKAIGCAVGGGLVLAVIFAWLLGFFTWLSS